MIVYGTPVSPFVRKILSYLIERELAYELVAVGIADPNPDYAAVSPFRKMPAIKDGDFGISDSSAILTYLEAKYPGSTLTPDSAEDKARVAWFDEFADTMLTATGGKIFFNRVVAPKFMKQEGDEAAAKLGEAEMPKLYAYLESVIDGSGYLVGGKFTIADISVATALGNLRPMGHGPDAAEYPKTAAYLDAIYARPSIAGPHGHFEKIYARVAG
ncbi:MAG: glutathione S-transferase family protein [Sphingorhabdus sp.]